MVFAGCTVCMRVDIQYPIGGADRDVYVCLASVTLGEFLSFAESANNETTSTGPVLLFIQVNFGFCTDTFFSHLKPRPGVSISFLLSRMQPKHNSLFCYFFLHAMLFSKFLSQIFSCFFVFQWPGLLSVASSYSS